MHLKNQSNIMVLCNNEIAMPALQQLFGSGSLKAIGIPENNQQLFSILQPLLAGTDVKLFRVNKKNLVTDIAKSITEKKITAVWLMTFPYIIPSSLLTQTPGGFVNFHYGLLPKYRGANPVLAQMLQQETESGVTIHLVDQGIDTGPIVMQQKIAIQDNDTFGIQMQKLGGLAASMALNLLRFYQLHPIPPSVPQDESNAQYFKKPTAVDLMINWSSMTSKQIIRIINACNPWNKGAGAIINNMVVCLTAAELTEDSINEHVLPGTIVALDDQNGLKIYCIDNKTIKVNIIYTPEGFFTGKKLSEYGVKIKNRFIS